MHNVRPARTIIDQPIIQIKIRFFGVFFRGVIVYRCTRVIPLAARSDEWNESRLQTTWDEERAGKKDEGWSILVHLDTENIANDAAVVFGCSSTLDLASEPHRLEHAIKVFMCKGACAGKEWPRQYYAPTNEYPSFAQSPPLVISLHSGM